MPGIAVFLSAQRRGIPRTLLHNLKHNKILHKHVLLVSVDMQQTSTVAADERARVVAVGAGISRVVLRYGFTEDPDLPLDLENALPDLIGGDAMAVTYFLGHETIRVVKPASRWRRLCRHVFAAMVREAAGAARYFSLPPNQVIEIGAVHEM